jgi:hypothetical protein
MYRPPYLKLKIDLEYNTKAPKIVIFDRDDDKSTRNRIEPSQVDEVYNCIKYLSKVRCIVEINRVYALKNNNLNGKKNYGVILKINTVECLNNYMKINEIQDNENTGLDFMD